jgi:hypothetical protein
MSDFQPTITEAQALQVIVQGVNREQRTDSDRTLAYCKDAAKLRGFNVRKLSQKLEARAEDKGETFNADSYQSNISNANGVMGLFDYDLEAFEAWLKETHGSKSLTAIFKAFRQLFTEPKETKPKANKADGDKGDTPVEATPLIDVVLSALPLLTAEERQLVAMLIIELDTKADDETEVPVEAAA